MEASNLSQIYGIKKDELVELAGEERTRQLSLNYLKLFPGVTRIAGMRKAKTRAMVNALIQGHSGEGNHFITCYGCQFHFFYRGTLIYKWDAVEDTESPVDAGAYEDTASTRNQRKEIQKSIQNFREAVFSL